MRSEGGRPITRQGHFKGIVGTFLMGCAVLLAVGCAAVRSEAPGEEEKGRTAATEEPARSPEATSEEDRCEGTRTFDVFKRQGIGYIADSSVQPGDPEARFITNDLADCPTGGLLSGTDKPDRLAGEDGEDELRGLGGSDHLTGGSGSDAVYGGPGNDELKGGGWTGYGDRSKDVLYGGPGRDVLDGGVGDDVLYGGDGDDFTPGPPAFPGGLSGGPGKDVLYGGDGNDLLNGGSGPIADHQRDELYCGEGEDHYIADKLDYVDSSCEVNYPPSNL